MGVATEPNIEYIAKALVKQIDKNLFNKKYMPVKEVLKLVGAGFFLAASLTAPNLPLLLKYFRKNNNEYEVWKQFNISYLKRTLRRLEKQKMIEIKDKNGKQSIEISNKGKKKILEFALDELIIEKPKFWDKKWRLLSYDIPTELKKEREILREYLLAWKFYPLHESVFLHAYPCEKEIEFLREYIGVGEYVRIFIVWRIENDKPYKDFFNV